MPAPLTSLQNPRILAARKLLRRGGRSSSFLVEGPIGVREALRSGAALQEIFVTEGAFEESEWADAAAGGTKVWAVDEGVMKSLTDTTTPQGVVAVVERPSTDLSSLPATINLALVLVGVRDPGNAGTLLRTAVAAGVQAIIFTEESVDPFGPKTVRSSAGMLFHVPVIVEPRFSDVRDALRSRDVRLVAAEATSERSHHQVDLQRPVAFAVGNEAWGFPSALRDQLDDTVSIFMPGPAESLNVAVAGSLLVFEAVRQRSAPEA